MQKPTYFLCFKSHLPRSLFFRFSLPYLSICSFDPRTSHMMCSSLYAGFPFSSSSLNIFETVPLEIPTRSPNCSKVSRGKVPVNHYPGNSDCSKNCMLCCYPHYACRKEIMNCFMLKQPFFNLMNCKIIEFLWCGVLFENDYHFRPRLLFVGKKRTPPELISAGFGNLYCIYQTISRQQQLCPAYCNNKQSSYKNNRSCC